MSMFANLTTDNMEEAKDTVGGGFEPVPSSVYDAVIKVAYAGQSQGGARNVTVHVDVGGQEIRETIYITNKKGENFYISKENGKTRIPLPGFTTIDDLCLLTTGQPLAEQDTEEKMVKVYDFDEKKEVAKPVPCITALHGQKVKLGILRVIEDKNVKNDAGVYVPSGETRTVNTIDKVFHAETGRTVNEYKHGIDEPEFLGVWTEKNQGKDRDKAKGRSGTTAPGTTGTGRPGAAGGNPSPKKSLFG